jgi:hypothetical protein
MLEDDSGKKSMFGDFLGIKNIKSTKLTKLIGSIWVCG